ncbi:hypothetical protein [Bauldia litoralis]|uniref:hypothetical protein n=1 Tax=Bauldia litoralis TaxID=665467 RepID=UPI00326747BE
MNHPFKRVAVAVLLGASLGFVLPAQAAAPVDFEPDAAVATAAVSLTADYKLDTEMVVRNWVLCISRAFAQQLAEARQTSARAALATYNDLKAEKSCGRFSEMRVILQAPVYGDSSDRLSVGGDALVFEALVDLAGNWASAYVVSGSLPSQ